jgi:hypothetical protein
MSDDGRFVFFSTGEQLVPQDTNGTTQDLYGYDTVTHVAHLLSSGAPGSSGSYFVDANRSGRDVFFTTRDQLVGWDLDEHVDLYDARIGGGFPEPVKRLACDANDACRSTPRPAATFAAPTSNRVSGEGNPRGGHHRKAKRCPKAKVRRKVHGKKKCVRRKHAVPRHAANARIHRSGGR